MLAAVIAGVFLGTVAALYVKARRSR